jgi:hypothetical protein
MFNGQPPASHLSVFSTGESINKMRPKEVAFHRARGSPNPLKQDKYNLFLAGIGTFFDPPYHERSSGVQFLIS